jgi:hypothetical protein
VVLRAAVYGTQTYALGRAAVSCKFLLVIITARVLGHNFVKQNYTFS